MRRCFFPLFFVGAWVCAQAQQASVYPRIETGAHSAVVHRIDVDAGERFLFSASDDKTVRVWDLQNGKLLRILRPPIGPGNEGKLYAVAASPDGASVAAGGFTGAGGVGDPIYIFDRESGSIRKTINGLPDVTDHLAYSRDGHYLAVALGGADGIRVYRTDDYTEVARNGPDDPYGADSYSAKFDKSGRMVTTSYDGFIRLYDPGFHLLYKKKAPGGKQPYYADFSPDGRYIAVGFEDSNAVDVLSADDLSLRYTLATPRVEGATLSSTLWSADGKTICAGGRNNKDSADIRVVLCWADAGKGKLSTYPVAGSSIFDLRALRDGALGFASADGSVGVLDPTGTVRWRAVPDLLDLRGDTLRVSSDGNTIEITPYFFNGKSWTDRHALRFSVHDEILGIDSKSNDALSPPVTSGLAIDGWKHGLHPALDGRPLTLDSFELSRSLAISPGKDTFVLGADFSIRKFDLHGQQLWRFPVPGTAWQVNITADSRFVIAALADGTIRWYTFDKGEEVLALFVDRDLQRWVAWNPDGFFNFKGGGDSLIGYQVNHGPGQAGEFVKVDQLREVFYRADLIDHILAPDGAARIVAARKEAGDVTQALSAGLPPQIELVSPSQAEVIDGYELQFKVKDMGGGVGRLVYRIDGAEIEGRSVEITGTARDTNNRYISVGGGQHTLTVAGYSSDGKVLGQPATIQLTGRRPAPGSTTSLYVIAAGISRYSDHSLWEGAKFASADADLVAATFKQQEGKGLYQKVTTVALEDSRATAKAIQDAVVQAKTKVQPGDTFVLYLAGHGITVDGEYYFVPWDAENTTQAAMLNKSLKREEIQALLKQVLTSNNVLILDTCFAGAFAGGEDTDREKAAIEKLAVMSGRAVLAASNREQMALEGYNGHGVFTYALVQGLTAADSNAQGEIMISRLAEYVQRTVPDLTSEKWHYRQNPVYIQPGDLFPIAHKAN